MINRRTFLTGVLAATLVPAWESAKPDLSSDEAIDQAWDYLLDDPVAFFVDAEGTLGLGFEPESPPETRSEAFDLSLTDLESPSQLADAADMVEPVRWAINNALGALRNEHVRDAPDWPTARQLWSAETGKPGEEYPSERSIQILRDLPEDPAEIDNLEGVLQSLPLELFEQLRVRLADWLEDEPNSLWEQDHFASSFQQQEGALEYFNNLGVSRDVLRELGVRIVEGEHPGSTYYAAELRLPLEEANRRARQVGIPLLFVAHEERKPNPTAEKGA